MTHERTKQFSRRATRMLFAGIFAAWAGLAAGCVIGGTERVSLITLDPGHFHASLVQKTMYANVDPEVHVFSPGGDELAEHLKRIEGYNTRADLPTHWRETVYAGPDYLEKMLATKPGNVVVISGNNLKKTDYILQSVQAGMNVLADKPMVISPAEFVKLQQAFKVADEKHVLLFDIMTERFEINTVLQRELSQMPALFGTQTKGTAEQPGIEMESVHYFSKTVSGSQLKRPAWFFDVKQEGEAIPDVGVHLIDLIQWEAFPGKTLSPADVTVTRARRWSTPITREQFKRVTGADDFPPYLITDVRNNILQEYSNGEMTYRLRDVWCKVTARWDFEAVAGGDTHYSLFRGSKANLVIRQGAAQGYKPVLYVEKAGGTTPPTDAAFEAELKTAIDTLQSKYPGVTFKKDGTAWMVSAPAKYDVGHEAHFGAVTENFLAYLKAGKMPAWEVPNMLTKYATAMKAYEMSR